MLKPLEKVLSGHVAAGRHHAQAGRFVAPLLQQVANANTEEVFIELRTTAEEHRELGSDGFRVLALPYRDVPPRPAYSADDETDLVLRGYVAFLDPPKDSARPAIEALRNNGVSLKVLTGDNELVSRKICQEVGVNVERLLLGGQIEALTDAQLADAAAETVLFARLSPVHKQRIIRALQARGHVVGFLGDGINDAPALRTADVGISVDTAVDIAKESADAILLIGPCSSLFDYTMYLIMLECLTAGIQHARRCFRPGGLSSRC